MTSVLQTIDQGCLAKALQLLPSAMNTKAARAQLLKTTLQEAQGVYRRQFGNGPARGLWQFELGTEKSRGGVWGVFLHPASRNLLEQVCNQLDVPFQPSSIYAALEQDDVLAAAVARLAYWCNPKPLPAIEDEQGSWDYYLNTWRPGKPHRETWTGYHAAVVQYLATQ